MSEFVTIAHIVKTRGVKGEVAAEILTDFPQRFQDTERVRIETPAGSFQERLQSHRFHKRRVLLKFQGRETPDEVAELVWGDVQVPLEERVEGPPGHFYNADLVNCEVRRGGQSLGRVEDVLDLGGAGSNLIIRTDQGAEWQLPLVREYVLSVDLERGRIEADPPQGLLELAVRPGPGKRKQRRARRRQAASSAGKDSAGKDPDAS
ncbi:MAG TPA: ribosome maturation factor RimM [Acidobacteriota bacterium]|nr:ribosome maturation factor RimM [Acidobacteriota bacterium]